MPTKADLFEQQIERLHAIAEMADDPLLIEAMRQAVAAYDEQTNGHRPDSAANHKPRTRSKHDDGDENTETGDTTLSQATRVALRSFGGRIWAIQDIVNKMLQQGYEFTARDPRIAVHGFIKRNRDYIETVEEGSGSNPSKYRYTGE